MPLDRKTPTEGEIAESVRRGELEFAPLAIRPLEDERTLQGDMGADACLEVRWGDRQWRFVVECKARSVPRVFREALGAMRRLREAQSGCLPLLVTPFLSRERLIELERNELSGIDLSGNGVIVVPGELLVFRSGYPRIYSETATIRDVFRGSGSLVARAFVLRSSFASVNAIRDFIVNRGGQIAISTVSKALKRLDDELLVGRSEEGIRVLQPDRILDLLAAAYRPPRVKRRFFGRTRQSREDVLRLLEYQGGMARGRVALTGLGSVAQYAVMAREGRISLYMARLSEEALRRVREAAEEGDRFWNLEMLETDDKTVFFDIREEGGRPWASPVQTYLELSQGDKRDKEAAESVKQRILSDLGLAWQDIKDERGRRNSENGPSRFRA